MNEDDRLDAELRQALALDAALRPVDLALKQTMKDLILRQLSDEALALIAKREPDSPVYATRVAVADVLACEAFYLSREEFLYSTRTARAKVAGLVLKRWFFRDPRSAAPEWDAVEAAHELLDELASQDDPLGRFVAMLSQGARAELVADAVDIAQAFEESWGEGARPRAIRADARLRVKLLGGGVILAYRVSLRFRQPTRSTEGPLAAVVLLDVRGGHLYEEEERYNRWYASLLELLQTGVPPLRAATWYAESQSATGEDIDAEKLAAAARRVGTAVARIAELDAGTRPPSVNPGWRCQQCVLAETCPAGIAWLQNQ